MSVVPERVAPAVPVPSALAPERPANPLFAVRPHGRVRRFAGLVVAGTALVLLAPLMGVIAVLVAFTSDGPVFFRHRRVGHGGVPFEVIKFRTMYDGAEALAARLFAEENHGSGPLDKHRDDPRVTSVGRWLRRSSLDEPAPACGTSSTGPWPWSARDPPAPPRWSASRPTRWPGSGSVPASPGSPRSAAAATSSGRRSSASTWSTSSGVRCGSTSAS
ncbi:sugar transferase [Nocardioides sp. W3-2-3]|nr:sugar transferase [Nocardioides convexus]